MFHRAEIPENLTKRHQDQDINRIHSAGERGGGGFWPDISNRFIGTRCRIHIAKWPLVQTDCSKPVRACCIPPLFFSLLFVSITIMMIPEWCFSRRIFRVQRLRNKKSNYSKRESKGGKGGKGRKSELWYVSTTRTIIITAKLYPWKIRIASNRFSKLLSLSNLRSWNDESLSLSLSLSMTLGPLFMFGKVKGTKLCQPRILQVAIYTHHRNRNFGSVHVRAAISSRSIPLLSIRLQSI